MERLATILRAAVILTVALLAGCSGAKGVEEEPGPRGETDPLVPIFTEAYQQFRSGALQSALPLFEQVIARDTVMYHFEAYAFRAQCLRTVAGDSIARHSFEPAWTKLRKYRPMMVDSDDVAAELKLYQYSYPDLPEYLTEAGGFVPYDSMPRPLAYKVPIYPEQTLELGKTGRVWVQYQLFSNGSIKNIRFLESDRPAFEEAVRRVAGSWRFTPYIKKGRKMPCKIAVPFGFRIR